MFKDSLNKNLFRRTFRTSPRLPKKEKADFPEGDLIDIVFSWSLEDALNKDLYKHQVKKIPDRFNSSKKYLHSFVGPLIEEMHADLLSCVTAVSQAPSCELYYVRKVENKGASEELLYQVGLSKGCLVEYQPQHGDLVLLTDVKPQCISDLNRPTIPFLLAYVQISLDPHEHIILSSKPILTVKEKIKEEVRMPDSISGSSFQEKFTLNMVYLTNMTTNIRIWNGLHPDPRGGNLKMIKKVIQMNGDEARCAMCISGKKRTGTDICFKSFGLNESQENAIISCIDSQYCHHENTVKLIWGPPGTGKTKTVSVLLFALLRMKCGTVICAPTNIAVVEVASRLMSLVTKTDKYGTYGFGDVVLFGNRERMMIDDHEGLIDIFLNYRIDKLVECFSPIDGWKTSLESMINILEKPEAQYLLYLANWSPKDKSTNHKMVGENSDANLNNKNERNDRRNSINEHSAPLEKTNAQDEEAETDKENPLTLKEYFKKKFSYLNERLKLCVVNLYTHLPTQFIPLEVVKEMMLALDFLRSLQTLTNSSAFSDEGLKEVLNYAIEGSEVSRLTNLAIARKYCLRILKSLRESFQVPACRKEYRRFCLENASLIFCTVSSSCKLNSRIQPLDLLVIDEAAQLKESESTIPFQLRGLRHAILVGDERQLPAMIQSKVSAEANFGRSLFERLVLLGQKRQLLNIQYRMHPAISSFPNKEFYDGRILDASAVKDRSHEKHFLHGRMYGAYSFINVACGLEQHDHLQSLKNMIEVAVVCQIVASLFKEFTKRKQRICIGVISPYKAQVHAIQEKLEKKYREYADSGFNVRARSVDGFQGGEEDVIIISTVRCNINGSVGFLSNHQRTNVALTRARHCLWVLGNEATLIKSGSVWKKLVTDARKRDCFYNADEDKNMGEAIISSLLELEQFDTLGSMVSLLLKDARWKIKFSNDFWKSMSRIKSEESHKQILNLLQKLSTGWRHKQNTHSGGRDSSGMLEVYPVIGSSKYLLWSIDIIKENASHFIQVLKVWNILPLVDIPKFAKRLEMLFGEYSVKMMRRCKARRVEGNLVVPMRWAVEEFSIGDDNLLRRFASLSFISDESSASTA